MSELERFGLDRLTVDERISLIDALWESIEDEAADDGLTPEQREDLDRRMNAYEANPKCGSNWEEVKARLRNSK
jgi:putative addiction module component (TIGR02574 family)